MITATKDVDILTQRSKVLQKIAASPASCDLHQKKRVYHRAGVENQ